MPAKYLIPVADAPLEKLYGAEDRLVREIGPGPAASREKRAPQNPYFVGLLLLAMFSFLAQFTELKNSLYILVVYARYCLWPLIIVGAVVHVLHAGTRHLSRTILLIMPFFATGVFAGLVGFNMIESARLLTFWLLAVVAAATIGGELRPETTRRMLFWIMMASLVLAIILVFTAPDLALRADNRSSDGAAWRGAFPDKNMLGLVGAYALVIWLCVRSSAWWVRALLLAVICVCLFFSNSQGGIVTALAGAIFFLSVGFVRRTSLSPGAQATLLASAMILGIIAIYLVAIPLLELLGRDPSLTGRTDIWAAYLQRALSFWMTGAGPGSFTQNSPVTMDLSVSFEGLGAIHTPHNMFIAAFGEVGIIGLIAFTTPIFYFAFVLPFRNRLPTALLTSALAFSMLVGGLIETHEVFGPGLGMFLLILTYSALRREEDEATQDEPDHAAVPNPFAEPLAPAPCGPQVLA